MVLFPIIFLPTENEIYLIFNELITMIYIILENLNVIIKDGILELTIVGPLFTLFNAFEYMIYTIS